MSETESILMQASGLVKIYGSRCVVNHVSLEVRKGEVVGLLGPNGAGKTTTFYMIVGLINPDAGSIARRTGPACPCSGVPGWAWAMAQEPSIFRN